MSETKVKHPKNDNLDVITTIIVAPELEVDKIDFEELEKLPGVGHKTASVVMAQGFGFPAFPVDTHIHRLAQRWDLTSGKNVEQLGIYRRYPANITRIFRGGMEIMPSLNANIEFGDTVRIVGESDCLDNIAEELGNSRAELAHPNIIPIFLGIFIYFAFIFNGLWPLKMMAHSCATGSSDLIRAS